MFPTYVFNSSTGKLEELESTRSRDEVIVTAVNPFQRTPEVIMTMEETNLYLRQVIGGMDDYDYQINVLINQKFKLKQLVWLLGVHAGNTDTFGSPEGLRVMWIHGPEDVVTNFGLCIASPSFLQALKVNAAAIGVNGGLFFNGQAVSVEDYIRECQTAANHALEAFPAGTIREGVTAQWHSAMQAIMHSLHTRLGPSASKEGTVHVHDIPWFELASAQEVMMMLDIANTTLSRYRSGDVPGHKPPFPDPIRFKGRSPHWTKEQIREWRDASI
jgi:predicted DNA-binding transcriptional regulator AlpA